MEVPDATALVHIAKRELGVTSDHDLGFELRTRYGVRSAQSTINRWGRGLGKPGYEATVALLHASGWLDEPAIRRDLGEGIPAEALAELEKGEPRVRGEAERQERARDKRKSA